jgi:hypothetical protein
MFGEIIMQKQYVRKISAVSVASILGFGISQALAVTPASLKLTIERPIITMLPGDGGTIVRLSTLDAMGQPATLEQPQTFSVTSGGVFSNLTKSAIFPQGLSTINFPVGGGAGVFKPTSLGVGTLQAAFASLNSLQSNTLEIQVTNGQTTVEEDDIPPLEMSPHFEFLQNMHIKIRGGFSINGGKRLAHGKAKRGDRINARFKITINPLHQNKPGKFFAVLRMEIPGQPDSWFDLGTWQPWVFGNLNSLGGWGGAGRVGHTYNNLPSELELLDFDDETQNGFFQQFPAGTKFTAAGGYVLDGGNQWHLGVLPLDID